MPTSPMCCSTTAIATTPRSTPSSSPPWSAPEYQGQPAPRHRTAGSLAPYWLPDLTAALTFARLPGLDDLGRDVCAEPVVGVSQVQGRQPFDALDPVGDGVDVYAEHPGGLLQALVLLQVDRQGPDQVHLVPGIVVDERAEHVLSELPQLMHVRNLQQEPVNAE